MPDKQGNKTLRDMFPLYCTICNGIIKPTRWSDGELVEEGQPYWLTGIVQVSDGWVSTYAHKQCRGMPTTTATSKTLSFKYDAPQTCMYCAKECEGRFCSERCRALYEQDVIDRQPSAATLELIEHLRQMREQQIREEKDSVARGGARGSNGSAKQEPKALEHPADELPPFVPQNEVGVVFMFGNVIDKLGYRMAVIDGRYPDAVVVSPSSQVVRIEFEYVSSNFVAHHHDPELCDLVVCWTRDRHLPLPTIALSKFYNAKTGKWNFSDLD